jgi:hypothetical protein
MHCIACTSYKLHRITVHTEQQTAHFFSSQVPLVAASFLISARSDNNVHMQHSQDLGGQGGTRD